MIGLSVAIGRFIEALFWAILKAAGSVAGIVALACLAATLLWMLGRAALRRRRR